MRKKHSVGSLGNDDSGDVRMEKNSIVLIVSYLLNRMQLKYVFMTELISKH